MFERYKEDWQAIALPVEADERICRALEFHAAPEKRANGKAWKIAFAAALLCVFLVGGVCAVSGFNFSEIPESFRLFYGIETGVVPDYVSYETVTVEASSVYSDVRHEGVGEIYLGADAIQTENLVVVSGSITTVTEEQYENYVWRAQLEGQEEYIPLEVLGGMYHGILRFRLTILKAEWEPPRSLRIMVYGGYESEDGKEFHVLRQGYMNVDIPAEVEIKVIVPETPIELQDEETGISGEIIKMEIHNDRLVLYYHVPGLDDMRERVEENSNDPESLKWQNAILHMTQAEGVCSTFASGEELPWLPTGPSVYEAGDVLRVSQYFLSLSDVESITVGDEVYEIN